MDNKIAFALWYGPQYKFGYGIATENQIHVTWLEKVGLCDGKYTSLPDMFQSVAKHQGWRNVEGLAMTIISEEMYEIEMELKAKANESTTDTWQSQQTHLR